MSSFFSGINLESYLIPLEEIKRATENFSQQRCIGDGGFGAVYKGDLSERWQNRTVAIKRLGRDSYQGEREFRNELQMISKFNHENIIAFVGYCDEGDERIIVYEYATNGSLDHHLQDPNKMRCITWTQRLQICIGAAKGLNHLHSGLGEYKRVIHRDVKSANILLDENLVAKICDFGLSKLGPRNQPDTQIHTKVAGTQFYLDPTYHESHILRKESDVYSFGVVLFEILSGMLVYHGRSVVGDDERQFLMNSVRRYYHIEPAKIIDPQIRDLIDFRSFYTFQETAYRCISLDVKVRPTFETVIERIEEALMFQTYERSTSTSAQGFVVESLLWNLYLTSPYGDDISCAIPFLAKLLTSSDTQTQELAMAGLSTLSTFDVNISQIISCGVVPEIVRMWTEGSLEARKNATATLVNLSGIYKSKPFIRDADAFFRLCMDHGTRRREGVVPMLIELLVRKPVGEIEDAVLSFLAGYATHLSGSLAIGKAEEALPALVEVLGSGSPLDKEYAFVVLMEVCSRDEKYLVKAQQHGLQEKLIDLLHKGTRYGSTKARRLLEKIQTLQMLPPAHKGKRKADQPLEDIRYHPLPPNVFQYPVLEFDLGGNGDGFEFF